MSGTPRGDRCRAGSRPAVSVVNWNLRTISPSTHETTSTVERYREAGPRAGGAVSCAAVSVAAFAGRTTGVGKDSTPPARPTASTSSNESRSLTAGCLTAVPLTDRACTPPDVGCTPRRIRQGILKSDTNRTGCQFEWRDLTRTLPYVRRGPASRISRSPRHYGQPQPCFTGAISATRPSARRGRRPPRQR
jgi:hypothetical protein